MTIGADGFTSAAITASLTLAVIIAIATIISVAIIVRRVRTGRDRRSSSAEALAVRAGAALLRADEALESAEQEVGYAIAQFGDDAARPFIDALASARSDVMTAFRLRQGLDEAREPHPRSTAVHREILALSQRASERLAAQRSIFDERRRDEVAAPVRIAELRTRIAALEATLLRARDAVSALGAQFTVAPVDDARSSVEEAATAIADAIVFTDAAQTALHQSTVPAVAGHVRIAEEQVDRAAAALDSASTIERDLRAAAAAWREHSELARHDVAEARTARDNSPDPAHGAAITAAMDAVRAVLPPVGSTEVPADPVRSLDRLARAVADLDTTLAAARNQEDRLRHARTALEGALVTARSQIGVSKGLIARGRGSLGARTRLAEAERHLVIAEAEADPVEALDAARRAITHARDAEDLARYDG